MQQKCIVGVVTDGTEHGHPRRTAASTGDTLVVLKLVQEAL